VRRWLSPFVLGHEDTADDAGGPALARGMPGLDESDRSLRGQGVDDIVGPVSDLTDAVLSQHVQRGFVVTAEAVFGGGDIVQIQRERCSRKEKVWPGFGRRRSQMRKYSGV
jgi:hypothetical protein